MLRETPKIESPCKLICEMDFALHHHSNCTETIHVLAGKIEQRIGDDWLNMSAGDTCLIPINTRHQTRNVGAVAAIMMIAYSAGTRVYIEDDE